MRLPDGTRLHGAYGRWRGAEYELGPVQADGTVVLKHHGENAPEGFEKVSSAREFSVPEVYWRKVPRSEIDCPVTVSSRGTWVVQGRQDHAPVGPRPILVGVLPWAEISDVRQEMEELPLPW